MNATVRDFQGFTSSMSFARLLCNSSLRGVLPTVESKSLPPRYAATVSIQYYVDRVALLMPIFSEVAIFSSLSAVYDNAGREVNALDHWTIRMILAISEACFARNDGDTHDQAALRHLSAAFDHAADVLHPGSTSALQATLLLAQYSLMDPRYFEPWFVIGMAARMLVDLGFHQDPLGHERMRKDELKIRRQIFSTTYLLDR